MMKVAFSISIASVRRKLKNRHDRERSRLVDFQLSLLTMALKGARFVSLGETWPLSCYQGVAL